MAAAQENRTKIQRRKDAETEKIEKANETKARIQQQTKAEEERRTQKKKGERIKQEQDTTKQKQEQEQREREIENEHKASEVAEAEWCEKVGRNKGSQRGSKEEALLLSGLAKRKQQEERTKREQDDRKKIQDQKQTAREIESLSMQRMSEEMMVRSRTTVKGGGVAQHVGAATVSGALLLEEVGAVESAPAFERTSGVWGAWSMMQDGRGSEGQQEVVEVHGAARGGTGGGRS